MSTRNADHDEGLTLIEVMVAMLVFALLATGIVAGLTTISRMTADDRARVTAQNLASREIDRMRAYADPAKVMAATSAADRAGVDYVVDGRTYTVKRGVSWISQNGVDQSCAGASLYALRINVRVSWPNMLANTAPVQDDTLLAAVSGFTTGSTGGLSISLTADLPVVQTGVKVTVTANTGGTAPTQQPANTDASGCSSLGSLTPGNYDVTLSKTGYIDSDQNATPTVTVGVTAGSTTSPQFKPYAPAANYSTKYVDGPVDYPGAALLPPTMETAFINGDSVWSTSPSAQNKVVPRYPYPTGYGVVAGLLRSQDGTQGCAAVDPQAWPAATVNGVAMAQGVRATAYAPPGGTVVASIPTAVVTVRVPVGQYVGVTQATSVAGTPSCALPSTYTWSFVSTGAYQAIALPYGSWKLYSGTSTSNATLLTASQVSVKTNAANWPIGPDGVVVLDPRATR